MIPQSIFLVSLAVSPQDSKLTAIPRSSGVDRDDRLTSEVRQLDPKLDGWDTEALNSAAGKVLNAIAGHWHGASEEPVEGLEGRLAATFKCTRLRPEKLATLYSHAGLEVSRGSAGEGMRDGLEGLTHSVHELASVYAHGAEVHVKFKILRVRDLGAGNFETNVLCQAFGDAEHGLIQQSADWIVGWDWTDKSAPPRIASLAVTRFEEVHAAAQLFNDCTASVLGTNADLLRQMLRGTDAWCAQLDRSTGVNQYAHQGLAIADVDGDGLEDVYVADGGGRPNRLLKHLPDGTVKDVSAEAGVDWLDETHGVLFADFDDDGDPDLVWASDRALTFQRNDGHGRFEIAAELPFGGGYSLAAADYDGDGKLDLYVCRYATADTPVGLPSPYHDANNGPSNALFRNRGNFDFEDVTVSSGIDQNNRRFSFAASWADYDGDGDQDLYVANDFGRNNLYRNDKGRFTDVAASAQVEDISAGMGASWGDYDGDGLLDLYVSNMFSSAGQRIAYQRRFLASEDDQTRSEFQRHARGNSLFRNRGDGSFEDVTAVAGVGMGRWAWGAEFYDWNGDGRLDVLVPNGFITNEDTEDL
jgi:hypothetical protein